jgi:hypothetical protein
VKTLFILLIVYQVKHFVADYLLQGRYMLGKFKEGWDFVLPLLAHVAVHAALTFCIVFFFVHRSGLALSLAILDASIHFFMDRIKAGKKYLGRWSPLTASTYPTATPEQKSGNILYWWSLGLDQMVHHCTHYGIIWIILPVISV